MRVKIIGECESARALRGLLRRAGFAVTEFLPSEAVLRPQAGYVITIEETESSGWIHLDSVDSALEAAILRHITQLSPHPVSVDRPGGLVHSDRELGIALPAGDVVQAQAVEFGVLRGLLELAGPKAYVPEPHPQESWWRRVVSGTGGAQR
jgi:hypothetical protein